MIPRQTFTVLELATVLQTTETKAAREIEKYSADDYVFTTEKRGRKIISRWRAYCLAGVFSDQIIEMGQPYTEKNVFTFAEVAKMMGVSPTYLRQLETKYPLRFGFQTIGQSRVMTSEQLATLFGGILMIWPDVEPYKPAPRLKLTHEGITLHQDDSSGFTIQQRKEIGGIVSGIVNHAFYEFAKANGYGFPYPNLETALGTEGDSAEEARAEGNRDFLGFYRANPRQG